MNASFSGFFQAIFEMPALLAAVVLTIGVIFVNGWTDAPNAVATCVCTRCMEVGPAILLSAVMNILGVLVMTLYNDTVAMTITGMVDFGPDMQSARLALFAALVAIILWAVAAWWFGIPTSESHALIAGLSGAAIAINGGLSGISFSAWGKVLYGLGMSAFTGFAGGMLISFMMAFLFRNVQRQRANRFFQGAQIFSAAAMSFMHGAQDGQKFLGVLLLGLRLAGREAAGPAPLWMLVLCAAVMGLGTALGGKKIIKSVGMDMAKIEKYQGFSADLASAGCLLLCSIFGIPASTTHTKTTAIMGAAAARRGSAVDKSVVGEMAAAWVLTFPGCGLIGFLLTKLFLLFG